MKRFISAALAALMLAGAFVACGEKESVTPETSATTTTSDAAIYADWLTERLGYAPENVILGIGSDDSYGIDLTNFEDDGYVLRTVGETTLIFGKTADGLDRAVRAYAKAVDADRADVLNETYHEGVRIERLTIAGRDISEYTVYYPETANENMKFAADELVRLMEKATGVKLPIVVGAPASPAIEFRHSDDPALKDEGYVYTVTEDGLLIEGAVARGCMHGVWRFFQHECGWDHLAYGDSYLNEADHIDIPVGTTHTETPAFDWVNIWGPEALGAYVTDRKSPTAAQNSYGAIQNACHGIMNNNFLPSMDLYWDQPCYNDEVIYGVLRDNIEAYIAARWGNPGFKDVDIASGDNDNHCYCEICAEIIQEENATSGTVVRFANQIVEEMNVNYPGLIYKIFAYAGTEKPPEKTKPHEQVLVTYCSGWNCNNHKFDGTDCDPERPLLANGNTNSLQHEYLSGWLEITDMVYMWHYNLDEGLQPYTVIDTIYDDYQYFYEMGVIGIMTQFDNSGFSFKDVEAQLVYEMNWNIDMTREEFEAILCKVLEHYCGDGWEYIRDYLQHLSDAQDMMGCFCCWVVCLAMPEERYNLGYFHTRFDNFMDMFDTALSLADSEWQQKNLELWSCGMMYMGCYSSYYFEWQLGNTDRIEVLSERYDRIIELMKKYGFSTEVLSIKHPGDNVNFSDTLEEAAWHDWYRWYEDVTGRLLPEDAPVIK